MTADRGVVALLALTVLVWGVAFSGGVTLALFTSTADVATTFETPHELAQIDESSGGGFAVATAPIENGTAAGEENGTAPAANGTETDGNASVPSTDGNGPVPPTDDTEADENRSEPPTGDAETDGNHSAPTGDTETDGNHSTPTDPARDRSDPPGDPTEPVTNGSASTGSATGEGSAAPDANGLNAVGVSRPPGPSGSGRGA